LAEAKDKDDDDITTKRTNPKRIITTAKMSKHVALV
jgi:hypothetical protein